MTGTMNHSGTRSSEPSARELSHSFLARELAGEGIVLLKNEGILPLRADMPIALLGSGSVQTVKGGTGSGDVNNRSSVSIRQGLEEAGAQLVSTAWLDDYAKRYEQARLDWRDLVLKAAKNYDNPFDAYAENPFTLPEGLPVSEEHVSGAVVAVYVVSRIAGEGKDRRLAEGDYYLSPRERSDLHFLNQSRIPTILLLNAGGPVELTDLLEECSMIRGVLFLSQLGQEGGRAVADVLLGKVCPSGHLTSTWERRYEDYPSGDTFGALSGNLAYDEYREGIFMGYRCSNAFQLHPLFPFGWGLSYASFSMALADAQVEPGSLTVSVRVKNDSTQWTGKEVVQLYMTLPQTGMVQEYQRLAGYAKTELLSPGEEQTVTISIPQKLLASFSEEQHGWLIEQGSYGLWIGSSSVDTRLSLMLEVKQTTLIESLQPICPLEKPFERLSPPSQMSERVAVWKKMGTMLKVPALSFVPQAESVLKRNPVPTVDIPTEELVPLLFGNVTEGASTLGSAGKRVPGSAGETSERLEEKYDVPSLIMADGPAGLRLRQSYEVDPEADSVYGVGVFGSLENGFLEPLVHHKGAETWYQFCTAFPVGTALAQSWNPELLRRFGVAIGIEMREFGVHLWLAPGMNLHRNPLCGRNFEYFSEDPLLSGTLAAAITRGVQSIPGCGVTIKHFACNNQEDNRMGVDARIHERTLRELYLRSFEIAVKDAAPRALMTSYNLVNGVHAANCRDLCTVVARDEWGFDGIIMSDWNTTVPEDGSVPWKCAMAGNDIIMPGSPTDEQSIRKALAFGVLDETAVRSCAERVIALALRMKKELAESSQFFKTLQTP